MPKNCKGCGTDISEWSNTSSLNRFCGYACAASWGAEKQKAKKAKALRKDTRERRESLKTLGEWRKEAQQAFNAFIKERDYHKPCIVHPDGCPNHDSGYHAGHFASVGSHPELRFVTWNVHKQCAVSNMGANKYARFSRDAHIAARYESALRDRIGSERVDWLKGPHSPKQYRVNDLKRIKSIFRRRANLYQRLRR